MLTLPILLIQQMQGGIGEMVQIRWLFIQVIPILLQADTIYVLLHMLLAEILHRHAKTIRFIV